MSEIEFSASVQIAINWVNRNLIYPSEPSPRPVPVRVDRGWITKAVLGDATPIKAPSADIKVLQRVIWIHVGTRPVVRICMRGTRFYRDARPTRTEWEVEAVEYRINWSEERSATYREVLLTFPTDLPRAIAPSDD